MCRAAKEAAWLNGLLEDLDIELRTPFIYGDNQGALALALALNLGYHPRSKRIDIQYHFTRERPRGTNHYQVSAYQAHNRGRTHEGAPPASIRCTIGIDGSLLGACTMVLQARGSVGILVTPNSAIRWSIWKSPWTFFLFHATAPILSI